MIKSMLHMRKFLWSKLRLSFGKEDRHGKEDVNSLMVTTNVNEEYKEAFRTKSYTEICNKVQGQLETRLILDEGQSLSSSSSSTTASSPSSPPADQVHLTEYLVEPCQETLISIFEGSKYHHFLGNYFDISLEAGQICEFILQDVHQVRVNYHSIRNVIKLVEQTPDHTSWSHHQYSGLCRELASFALHSTPFSAMTPEKFHELHDSHVHLFQQLTSQRRKTKRTKFIRCIKRALAIVGFGALAIALLVLAIHSMVGVVAAPGLIICPLVLFMIKKFKRSKQESKEKQLEGLGEQLDVAARGVYTLINDFDTMSRLVQRLHDEMEHRKFVAEISARKAKNQILKEVAREFQMHESCFQEQLEELENQIYLSFLDINRSRRQLLHEMDK